MAEPQAPQREDGGIYTPSFTSAVWDGPSRAGQGRAPREVVNPLLLFPFALYRPRPAPPCPSPPCPALPALHRPARPTNSSRPTTVALVYFPVAIASPQSMR